MTIPSIEALAGRHAAYRSSEPVLFARRCWNLTFQAPCLQVAMLWLIMYEVHQEEVWTNWLRRLSGTVHEDIQCNEVIRKCYQDHVLTTPAKSVYDEQGWFTFYVHSKPDAPDFPEGSIFAGRTVRDRIEVGLLAQTPTPVDACGPSCAIHDNSVLCGPAIHIGDIVVFKAPPAENCGEPVTDLVKRVIGLPGDHLTSGATRSTSTARNSTRSGPTPSPWARRSGTSPYRRTTIS